MHASSIPSFDDRKTLLVLPAMTASPGPRGGFILTQKFVDGAAEYASRWPGPVSVRLEKAHTADTNLDHVEVHPRDLPFDCQWLPGDSAANESLIGEAGIVLASLVDKFAHLGQTCRRLDVPLVYVCEYTVQTRRQIIRAETRNPLLRWRRERWTNSLERRLERTVRLADGIQCNGTPTHEAYRSINSNPLLYFDTRVRAEQLAARETLNARIARVLKGGPLRLAFSGRLIAMKGADHLLDVATELKRLGVPFTLDICGSGDLEPSMRRTIAQCGLSNLVRMRGVLDFKSQLMPFVSSEVDLFVCCHPQGDPSCTYLETMSCGTPMVGYDNEAFRGIVKTSGVGWLSPLGDARALANRIAELNRDRAAIVNAAEQSLAFASQHTFERTMQMRVDHLKRCAGSMRPAGAEVVA